jgi:Leucine-rich repeat (LRR) protein
MAYLDLSNKELTKISDDLSNNLKILNLNDNKIAKIENLPPNLHKLYLERSKIEKIENLP